MGSSSSWPTRIARAGTGPRFQRDSSTSSGRLARRIGSFGLQAAIAALHAEARSAAETDWVQIAALYEVLMRVAPTPVVELNRAVARAMSAGPAVGLAHIDAILARGELVDYQHAHSARAELLRRLGRGAEARQAYARALEIATAEPARRFIRSRLDELAK